MKKLISIFLAMATSYSFGQTAECDCTAPLNRDLTSKFTSTEYRDFKEWVVIYMQSDEEKRTELKRDRSASWKSKATVVLEGIPVVGENDAEYKSKIEDQTYYRMEQLYFQNRYLTDQQFNQIISEQMGVNQLEAYKACLDLCRGVMGNGVTYNIGGDPTEEFYIRINYNSTSGGQKITFAGDAIYGNNLVPIGTSVFKDGLEIADRQSKTQFFKRIDPTKTASFTFNVRENININGLTLDPKPLINMQAVPIGTIVSSILNYSSFLTVNGLQTMDNENMRVALWIPCDGRRESVSKYSAYSGGNIPDLRGLFLRGANEYNVQFAGVVNVAEDHKNPDNTSAGVIQKDGFKRHRHTMKQAFGFEGTGSNLDAASPTRASVSSTNETTDADGDHPSETRPRNMTVYYYIKIN